MGSERLVYITNIPSPYRVHLFERMYHECQARDIDFAVWFMAESEPGRFWECDFRVCDFPHRRLFGLHPIIAGQPFHTNPGAWRDIVKNPPKWLVLGGGWQFPTVFMLAFLKLFYYRKTHLLFHSEADYQFSSFKRGPVGFFRRAVLRRAEAAAIPGRVARETIRDHWGVRNLRFVNLPNIVNEKEYGHEVKSLKLHRFQFRGEFGLDNNDFVILFPARLHEKTKGNLNFLKAIASIRDPRLKVLLAGEGPDRRRIERWLAESRMSGVFLLGHQGKDQMLKLLALADLLALPSLRDPNPLAIIEGLWASLPILASSRCGNWPEAVEPGNNGWIINSARPEEIRQCVDEALTMPAEKLNQYGRRSYEIAEERFDSRKAVGHFIGQLINL
ncbi:MAG: glycosyltransferase family 4 protein [Candidatus Omnitrophica bacterium]|nr:glycosyltransferase family 4 protein [Candidatus Omnitrophota bacterium]